MMIRLLLAILVCFTSILSIAQNNVLRGIVKLQSSGAKPLSNTQISAFGAGTVYSNSAGMFEMRFTGKKPGATISLLVQKDGYELINTTELERCVLRQNPDDLVFIVMAKQGERNKQALAYYNIITGSANSNYKKDLKKIHKQLNELDEDDADRKVLRQQIEILQTEKEKLINRAEELAKQMATVDLDRASDLAKEAYAKFEAGDVKSALAVLSDEALDKNLMDAQREQAKIKKQLIQADSAIVQGIENYMIKARFCISDRLYNEAFSNYQKAIKADSLNLDNIWEMAEFCNNTNQQKKAIKYYEMALNLTSSIQSKSSLHTSLGHQYLYDNNYPKAKYHYAQAQSISEPLSRENPDFYFKHIASTQMALGSAYFDLHEYASADSAFQKALSIYLDLVKKDSVANYKYLARIFMHLGNLNTVLNHLDIAESYYLKSLKISESFAQEGWKEKDQIAVSRRGLGVFYAQSKHDYNNAEFYFLSVVAIYKKLSLENPQRFEPDLAQSIMNLGACYADMGDYPKVEKAYLESLEILKRLTAENPHRYEQILARNYLNLGSYYAHVEDWEHSEQNYLASYSIRKRLMKENPQKFALHYVHTILNMVYVKMTILKRMLDTSKKNEALLLLNETALVLDQCDGTLRKVKGFKQNEMEFRSFFESFKTEDLELYKAINRAKEIQKDAQKLEDIGERVLEFEKSMQILDSALIIYPSHEEIKTLAAQTLGDLSNDYLFIQQFQKAENASERALLLDSSQTWIGINLVISLLFQGDYEACKSVYSSFIDKGIAQFKEDVLYDLKLLSENGIRHKDLEKFLQFIDK